MTFPARFPGFVSFRTKAKHFHYCLLGGEINPLVEFDIAGVPVEQSAGAYRTDDTDAATDVSHRSPIGQGNLEPAVDGDLGSLMRAQ